MGGSRFQEQVFWEIAKEENASKRLQICELAAILQCIGSFEMGEEGEALLQIRSNRQQALIKCFTLLEKTFNITSVSILLKEIWEAADGSSKNVYALSKETTALISDQLFLSGQERTSFVRDRILPERLFSDQKSIRSALTGQFLCIGSVRDPQKEYYLSFEILSDRQAAQTISLLLSQNVSLRIVEHGKNRAIVTRDSDVIVDTLNFMGAHVSLMDMENARIMKQVRGRVNRKVNCETANIMKTVAASQRQLEEIRLLKESNVWKTLPESLKEIAQLREQYPESSLQELGAMLDPPVGKSGVNHRLRRLSALAQDLRQQNIDSHKKETADP